MDFPRPQRKLSWRDSAWYRATIEAFISELVMIVLAGPVVLWLAFRLTQLAHMDLQVSAILTELLQGCLLMLPYLWFYFFALERIARQRRNTSFSELSGDSRHP
jgi:hypothetical protein